MIDSCQYDQRQDLHSQNPEVSLRPSAMTAVHHTENLTNQVTRGDEEKLANMLNGTFQSVNTGLSKLEPPHQHLASGLPDTYLVSVNAVEKKLMAIRVKNAADLDGILTWMLQDFVGFLSPPITAIFTSSFRDGFILGV